MISCDKLANELYENGTIPATKIAATFGDHVVENGVVDRIKLGMIICVDKVGSSSL